MPAVSSSSFPSLIPIGKHGEKPPIPLNRPVTLVGSHENARLHLVSRSVSKAHCLIVNEDHAAYIHDLASRTHTILNGQEVPGAVLKTGDILEIGSFKFRFVDVPRPVGQPEPVPVSELDLSNVPEPFLIRQRVVLIGRRPTCSLPLAEDSVSTAHAVIYERNGERFIRDLGSRTGTRLNGKSVHDAPLSLGDLIQIGETTIRYAHSDVSPDILASLSPSGADELEYLIGTAPLVEEVQEAEPIDQVNVAPVVEARRTSEMNLDTEVDLSTDPDIVGSNDTQELPVLAEEPAKKPVLSERVVDTPDSADIAVEAEALSEAPEAPSEISSPERDKLDEPRAIEADADETPTGTMRVRRGWRAAIPVEPTSASLDETEPPVREPESSSVEASETKAESAVPEDVPAAKTEKDSVFEIPHEPDESSTSVLDLEPEVPPAPESAKLQLHLSKDLKEWGQQAAEDLAQIDFSKLDLSTEKSEPQDQVRDEDIAPLDLTEPDLDSDIEAEPTREAPEEAVALTPPVAEQEEPAPQAPGQSPLQAIANLAQQFEMEEIEVEPTPENFRIVEEDRPVMPAPEPKAEAPVESESSDVESIAALDELLLPNNAESEPESDLALEALPEEPLPTIEEMVEEPPLRFDLTELPAQELSGTADSATVVPEPTLDLSINEVELPVLPESEAAVDTTSPPPVAVEQVVQTAPSEPPQDLPPVPPSPTKSVFDELFGDAPEVSSFLGGMPLHLPDVPSNFGRVNIGFDARPIPAPSNGAGGTKTFATHGANIAMPDSQRQQQPTIGASEVPLGDTMIDDEETGSEPEYHPAEENLKPIDHSPESARVIPPPGSRRPETKSVRMEVPEEDQLPPLSGHAGQENPSPREEISSAFDGLAIHPPLPTRIPPRPVFSGARVSERDRVKDPPVKDTPGKKKKRTKKSAPSYPRDPFGLSNVPTEVPVQEPEESVPEARAPKPARTETNNVRPPMRSTPELTMPSSMAPSPSKSPSLLTVAAAVVVCMASVVGLIYTIVPVETPIEATLVFKNMENLGLFERKSVWMEERQLIERPDVRVDAAQRLASRAAGLGGTVLPSFLADPVQFSNQIDKGLKWSDEKPGVLSLTRVSTDPKGDKLRLESLLNALYTANQPKLDALLKKRRDLDDLKTGIMELQRKIQNLQEQIAAARAAGENRPSQTQLNDLEVESSKLEKNWIDQVTSRKDLFAEVQQLKQPITELVPAPADIKRAQLEKQLATIQTELVQRQKTLQSARDALAKADEQFQALIDSGQSNEDLAAFVATAPKLRDRDAHGRAEQFQALLTAYTQKLDALLLKLKADDADLTDIGRQKDTAEKNYKEALGGGDEKATEAAKAEFDAQFQKYARREQDLTSSQAEARQWPVKLSAAMTVLDQARQDETTATGQLSVATKLQADLESKLANRDKEFAAEQAMELRQRNLDREKQLEAKAQAMGNAEKAEAEAEAAYLEKKKAVIASRAAVDKERQEGQKLQDYQKQEERARKDMLAQTQLLEQQQAELAKAVEPVEPTVDNVHLGERRDSRATYSLISVLGIALVSLGVLFFSHRQTLAPPMAQTVPPSAEAPAEASPEAPVVTPEKSPHPENGEDAETLTV